MKVLNIQKLLIHVNIRDAYSTHVSISYSEYPTFHIFSGDHVRQDSMDFSKEWEDPTNCRCGDRLKPLERRAARQHQRCLAHSLVGTPNYIAPEVLLRTGNSSSVHFYRYMH